MTIIINQECQQFIKNVDVCLKKRYSDLSITLCGFMNTCVSVTSNATEASRWQQVLEAEHDTQVKEDKLYQFIL